MLFSKKKILLANPQFQIAFEYPKKYHRIPRIYD